MVLSVQLGTSPHQPRLLLRVTQAESPVKTHTRQANERSVLWKRKMTDLTYPSTRRDNITDDYHGTTLEDPYRWLEDTESEETAVWVQAQNDITFEYLSAIPLDNPSSIASLSYGITNDLDVLLNAAITTSILTTTGYRIRVCCT